MSGPAATGRRPWILGIDTATAAVVVAAGLPDGTPLVVTSWEAGHRHGETLLAGIDRVIADADLDRRDLVAVTVGTGPGAFTGLRVGLATAKGLAHALGLPIIGISTAEALLAAAGAVAAVELDRAALLLPAGPSDRVLVRHGEAAQLIPGGTEPDLSRDSVLVAVDLGDRAPRDAVERGDLARAELGRSLIRLGAARLGAGRFDDLAQLVPEYVTLPRGVRASGGEVTWSRDHR